MRNSPPPLPLPLVLLAVLALAACSNVKLDPFGRPYSPENAMAPGPLPCYGYATDTPPVLVSGSKPMYPIREHLRNNAASAPFEFIVYEDGKVAAAQMPDESSSWFARHMVVAMRDWVVRPAIRSGSPVTVTCRIQFSYELR